MGAIDNHAHIQCHWESMEEHEQLRKQVKANVRPSDGAVHEADGLRSARRSLQAFPCIALLM